MTGSPAHGTGIPPLTTGERWLLGAAVVLGGGVGGIGLVASFDTVAAAGARWGFGIPELLPIGIDLAIPVFTLANLLLIRMGMPLVWVRFVPWALTAVTCWLNVAAGTSLSAKIAHGTMPLLWVVLSEIAAHVYAARIGAATGRRMDGIRRSRWLLAPFGTAALWRRMVLWEITSYPEALQRERERQLACADLREQYGRGWRRSAPRRTRVLLALGEYHTASGSTEPVPTLVEPSALDTPVPVGDARSLSKVSTPDAPSSTATANTVPQAAPATGTESVVDTPAEPVDTTVSTPDLGPSIAPDASGDNDSVASCGDAAYEEAASADLVAEALVICRELLPVRLEVPARPRLDTDSALRVIEDGWKGGLSLREVARRATRSRSYVQQVYARLDSDHGPRPVPGQLALSGAGGEGA